MATVSVIIPCYKNANTLALALDSVYAQTQPVHEVLVINDCSPETAEIETILINYTQVRYIRNEENLGPSGCKNIAALTATGDFLAFLDADDAWHPQKTEFQLPYCRQGYVVTCRTKLFDGDIDPIYLNPFLSNSPLRLVRGSRKILYRNTLTGAGMMISRELFQKMNGYDVNLRASEDYDFWLRLLDAGITVCDLKYPLYLYRYNPNGLSKNWVSITYWEQLTLKKYFTNHANSGQQHPQEGRIWTFWFLKRIRRYEKTSDSLLLSSIVENLNLLEPWPFFKRIIVFLLYSRVLRFVSKL